MSERECRARVQVAHPLAALSERWGQVRVRLPSGLARYPDWQLSGGIGPARSTPASALPPSSTGKKAWTIAAARPWYWPNAYGRPDTASSTVGVPVPRTPRTAAAEDRAG